MCGVMKLEPDIETTAGGLESVEEPGGKWMQRNDTSILLDGGCKAVVPRSLFFRAAPPCTCNVVRIEHI
jgi:hypothetical protein